MKNFFKVIFSRAVFTGAFIALQFAAIFLAITRFNEHFALFYGICLVLSAVVVVYLVSRDGNPAYKIAWIIPILALPVFGVLLYLVFGKNQLTPKEKARMSSVAEQYEKAMRGVSPAQPALPDHTDAKCVSDYLYRIADAPVFTHTEATYLPVGEAYLEALLAFVLGQSRRHPERWGAMEYRSIPVTHSAGCQPFIYYPKRNFQPDQQYGVPQRPLCIVGTDI